MVLVPAMDAAFGLGVRHEGAGDGTQRVEIEVFVVRGKPIASESSPRQGGADKERYANLTTTNQAHCL